MLLHTVCFLLSIAVAYAEREHKVHNIVLYPDKHSWCQNTPIQQVVASSGYKSVTIDNIVCVGACFSYSIPKTHPSEPGEEIGPYCDSCQPSESKCYHVTLQAEPDTEGPPTIQKRVQIITNCSCTSCEKINTKNDCEVTESTTEELPSDFFVDGNKINSTVHIEISTYKPEDVPELLNEDLSKRNDSYHHHFVTAKKYEHKYELTSKLLAILKEIQENNGLNLDKHELKELIKMIRGSEKKLNDKNLMEFVNFVNVNNNEDLELDLTKLKEILNEYLKNQGLQMEIDSGIGLEKIEAKNEDIERDFTKYNLPEDFGLEGSRLAIPPHLKGSHIGMGIHHKTLPLFEPPEEKNSIEDLDEKPLKFSLDITGDLLTPKPTKPPHHGSHHENHAHHHVGEEQQIGLAKGHLITGPHGSMAFSPDSQLKVEEKLNLDTENLKPNAEGTVISYENTHEAMN